jgi:hypothetical protein
MSVLCNHHASIKPATLPLHAPQHGRSHHFSANQNCLGIHKLFLLRQSSAVVKKCRTANLFLDFYATKSIAAFGKSMFFTVEE